jgi:CheY-like chemotaxis protein
MGSVNPLLGRSVLIVEDEPLIALELHDALQSAGASILAATTIEEALELIAYAQICAAIVDVNLGGQDCSSVCDALAKRSIPFIFYTGYAEAPSLSQWPSAPAVGKPAEGRTLVDAISHLIPSLIPAGA